MPNDLLLTSIPRVLPYVDRVPKMSVSSLEDDGYVDPASAGICCCIFPSARGVAKNGAASVHCLYCRILWLTSSKALINSLALVRSCQMEVVEAPRYALTWCPCTCWTWRA